VPQPRITTALLVALALVGAGCSVDESPRMATIASAPTTTGAPVTTSPAPLPETTAVPETAAPLSVDELRAALDVAVEEWMAATGVPGLGLTVLLPDGEELTLAWGVRDLVSGEAVAPDAYWRIASITKPMTSAVVLRLAEQGLVELDAPVTRYLGDDWAAGYLRDGVDYGPQVTIAQLLNHTDGFKEYAFDRGFYLLVSNRLDVPMDPREVLDWAVGQGPQYIPGTAYLYNTVGHLVAGLVIEQVTGRPAHEVLRRELFDLVGADDAYLTPKESPPDPVPAGYVQGLLKQAVESLPSLAPYREAATVGGFFDITAGPQAVLTSAPFTGGGVEAQTDDVARVFRGLFDGTVLSPGSIEAFVTTVPETDYGLGISVASVDGVTVYSHGGGVPGFRSHAFYAPDLDVAVAFSANLIPLEPDVDQLAQQILAIVRTAR
jgi:D-alanyl-D-alanine carboxypeptidase